MTGSEFLVQLQQLGVQLWAEGDAVRYKAPKDALTQTLRAEMTRRKAELLRLLHESYRPTYPVARPPLLPVSRDGELPLSFGQERLWFIDQLDPDNPAYNISLAIRVRGAFHVTALERTFNEIVRRHEIFRTTCSMVNRRPVQSISPALTIPLRVIDLREVREPEKEATVRRLATEESRRRFDLSQGPFLQICLLRLDEKDYVLILKTHHFVADGWSMRLFFQELSTLYGAFSTGKSSPLPDLVIQYADFGQWQRQCLQADVLEPQIAYWKKQLDGAPAVLELATDHPRPPIQTYRGASETFVLPKNLSDALKELSRHENVTLFMTLLAAFQTLLYRYTGQDDIVVGTAVSNRNRTEIEQLIGPFANDLVLRTDLSGNPTFRALLDRVREVAVGAYAHQDLPFEKLVEELQPKRDLAHHPLFQIMFILHQQDDLKFNGLSVNFVEVEQGTAIFDLTFSFIEKNDSLSGSIEYNTDLFDAATIKRMSGHYQTLLESIIANPNQRLSELALLTEAERRRLQLEWNSTEAHYPKEKCIHQLFEEQVEQSPDAAAVIFQETQLSYRELNERANQLAHHLRKCAVGPEVLVGICMERSVEMLVALFGVLKSGGAYVPLDPQYPRERLAFMLEDAQAAVLLTQRNLIEQLPGPSIQNPKALLSTVEGSKVENRKVIYLDSEWEVITQESKENPRANVTADNLAYVIYTSGSTGKPKGVGITHRSFTNFTVSACASYALEASDRVLQFASISFDTAAEEIYPSLMSGAGLVLRADSMLESASSFLQCCAEWKVTVLDLPTAYWHELTEQMVAESLTAPEGLRLVIIGGERAVPERLAQWRKAVGDRVRLLNTYGPTEATVVATKWESAATADQPAREVPIGRPISNVRTYVLDRRSNPVPIGIPGELHIGGVGLARGYLSYPDLTAEKFIPDLFGDECGGRLYRTGDLARYLPDGNIEFLGRIDHQIKIRGFRIELAEIEAVLAEHPAVRQAAVHLWKVQANDVRIVACCVPAKAGTLAPVSLRKHLRGCLPEYMIPQYFLPVEEIPLTPNGKIDRSKLPVPAVTENRIDPHEAPSDPIEATIAEIWTNLIGPARPIGRADKFFEMGGHSLLALQALRQIENKLGVRLDLRVLFQESLAEIATKCRSE